MFILKGEGVSCSVLLCIDITARGEEEVQHAVESGCIVLVVVVKEIMKGSLFVCVGFDVQVSAFLQEKLCNLQTSLWVACESFTFHMLTLTLITVNHF